MELWQLDIMSGIWLTDGRKLKTVTGIDDHSRFCVAAGLIERANARTPTLPFIPLGFGPSACGLAARGRSVDAADASQGRDAPSSTGALEGLDD
jgi:hypothetical protein